MFHLKTGQNLFNKNLLLRWTWSDFRLRIDTQMATCLFPEGPPFEKKIEETNDLIKQECSKAYRIIFPFTDIFFCREILLALRETQNRSMIKSTVCLSKMFVSHQKIYFKKKIFFFQLFFLDEMIAE